MEDLQDVELKIRAMQFALDARVHTQPSFDAVEEATKIYKWLKRGNVKKDTSENNNSDRFTIEQVIDIHLQKAKNRTFTKGEGELYIISQVYRWWEKCKQEGSKKYNNDQIIQALSKIFKIELCTQ